MKDAWQSIDEAYNITHGTVADLLMPTGRIYRAVWEYRGRACAWWPQDSRREKYIGLYSPAKFRVVAAGITPKPTFG